MSGLMFLQDKNTKLVCPLYLNKNTLMCKLYSPNTTQDLLEKVIESHNMT